MKKIVLCGFFFIWFLLSVWVVKAQNPEKISIELRESLEQAASNQAIGFEPEVSDSLIQMYLNLVHQLGSMQADTQLITRLTDTTSMLRVFEKYTRALAKEKRFVPDIRRLAF